MPGTFLVVVAGLHCVSCGSDSNPAPRNLLLVSFDTTRADRVGCYGHDGAETPTLDSLAAGGVRFENCFSPTPVTLPSHASMLTGLEPWSHGARNNATHHLPAEVVTLAERLQSSGFQTGAVVSALVLDSRYGLDQGFATYNDDLSSADSAAEFMFRETRASNTSDRALQWLKEKPDGRWFLWVHYFDPHADRRAPEPWASQVADPYDAEIAYTDSEFGRLLEGLQANGERSNTLVVMTADHGESLGEHGERTHGLFLYDATTRVPLIMQHGSLAQNHAVEQVVGLVDLAPTVLDLLGVQVSRGKTTGNNSVPAFDGVSLVGGMTAASWQRPPLYQESKFPFYSHGMAELRALRGQGFRYIRAPQQEYYDLHADPQELDNLHLSEEAQLQKWDDVLALRLPAKEADSMARSVADLPDEERQALAALGYVWDEDAETTKRRDPKDRVEFWERTQKIYELFRLQSWSELEINLLAALRENPESLETRKLLVRTFLETKKPQKARPHALAAANLPGASGEIFLLLAETLRACGEEAWTDAVDRARRANPEDPDPEIRLGSWLVEDGALASGEAAFRRALALDASQADAWMGLAKISRHEGNFVDAEGQLRRALSLDDSAPETWFALGVVLLSGGNPAAAESCFLETVQRQENHVRAWVNLGNLAQRRQEGEQSEAHYRRALAIRPRHPEANFNLGVLLLERGDPAASACFEAVLQARPEDARAAAFLREAQALDS